MAFIIFDLDHTVIDSSHRQLTKPDGSLDLEHWLENSTREKIFSDSLLPLADVMRRYYAENHCVIVCTARTATQHDFDYLAHHELNYSHILYREVGDNRPDALYKKEKLDALAISLGYSSLSALGAIMFDDNIAVIREMQRNRVICHDAISYNRQLRRGRKLPSYLERMAA
jgi:hypothetical protein